MFSFPSLSKKVHCGADRTLVADAVVDIPRVKQNVKTRRVETNLCSLFFMTLFAFLSNHILNSARGNSDLRKKLHLFSTNRIVPTKSLDSKSRYREYIETTAAEYREWNSKNTVTQQKRKVGSSYSFLSLDAGVPETGLESLHESVPSAFNLESLAIDHLLIDELKAALRKWKPWAEELLELYLSGAKRSCTNSLCEKYRLSDRAIQKRKTAFEKFVLDFLKK